jgi:hypothetical protein
MTATTILPPRDARRPSVTGFTPHSFQIKDENAYGAGNGRDLYILHVGVGKSLYLCYIVKEL